MNRYALLLILVLAFLGGDVFAQDQQPPAVAPAMEPNPDFDDMEEELMEMGDEGFRPPPPPPPPGTATAGGTPTQQNPPAPSFGGGAAAASVGGGNFGPAAKKLKFKIVEGEFWEKGKKRPRGIRSNRD